MRLGRPAKGLANSRRRVKQFGRPVIRACRHIAYEPALTRRNAAALT